MSVQAELVPCNHTEACKLAAIRHCGACPVCMGKMLAAQQAEIEEFKEENKSLKRQVEFLRKPAGSIGFD